MRKASIKNIRSELEEGLSEKSVLLMHLFKWLLLATIVGAASGALATAFLFALNAAVSTTHAYTLFYILLPLALVVNVAFIHFVLPDTGPPSTDAVIGHIHRREELKLKSAVKAFITPILTIASGGSAGKEAPAADMGASVGSWFGSLLRFDIDDKRKLAICGISAGFAAVFGTPIAGALFGIEVLFVGSLLYEVLLPAFVAGIIGYEVAAVLGAPFWYHTITVVPQFSELFFLKVVLAGVFFGGVAYLLILAMRVAKHIHQGRLVRKLTLAVCGGALIVALAMTVSTAYLGLGIEGVESTVAGAAVSPFAFLFKILFTALTFASGGTGGLVTPTLFIGSTAGAAYAQVMHADIILFAAIGTVAVLAGAMNTPIAASVLAIELFGPAVAPYAAIACIISFSMTGHSSLYPSQVFTITLPKKESWMNKVKRLFR